MNYKSLLSHKKLSTIKEETQRSPFQRAAVYQASNERREERRHFYGESKEFQFYEQNFSHLPLLKGVQPEPRVQKQKNENLGLLRFATVCKKAAWTHPPRESGVFQRMEVKKEAPVADPVSLIREVDLERLTRINIGSSRTKWIYLFEASGKPTAKKSEAAYVLDTSIDETEWKNYEKVAEWGVRVPKIYGKHKQGGAIVQWLPKQTTFVTNVGTLAKRAEQAMKLDKMNEKFNIAKWQTMLDDVKKLTALKYTSPDFQFMMDNETGHIYIMDLEKNNTPSKEEKSHPQLTELEELLTQEIKKHSSN